MCPPTSSRFSLPPYCHRSVSRTKVHTGVKWKAEMGPRDVLGSWCEAEAPLVLKIEHCSTFPLVPQGIFFALWPYPLLCPELRVAGPDPPSGAESTERAQMFRCSSRNLWQGTRWSLLPASLNTSDLRL